jgi:hypothetical protein
MDKSPQKNLWYIVIGVGLIALLVGVFSEIYSTTVGIIVAVVVWILGMPVLKLVMGGSEKKPEMKKPMEGQKQEPPMQAATPPTEPMREEPMEKEEPKEEPPTEGQN